ncbi:MAG: hypothetical protein MUE81_12070 [Thermoflexibacter sp.]|nr:hypothetical protein [Thermoflexibacter sp.]
MKIKIVCFFSLLFLFSCQKEISPYWGNAEMSFNGSKWEITELMGTLDRRCSEEKISLIIQKTNKLSGITEHLSFSHIPKRQGIYNISHVEWTDGSLDAYCKNSQICAYFNTLEFNASMDTYIILDNLQNYLEITDFDKNSKEIKGRFYLVFIVRSQWSQSVLPDTLRFTEGKFHARVQ